MIKSSCSCQHTTSFSNKFLPDWAKWPTAMSLKPKTRKHKQIIAFTMLLVMQSGAETNKQRGGEIPWEMKSTWGHCWGSIRSLFWNVRTIRWMPLLEESLFRMAKVKKDGPACCSLMDKINEFVNSVSHLRNLWCKKPAVMKERKSSVTLSLRATRPTSITKQQASFANTKATHQQKCQCWESHATLVKKLPTQC